MIPSTTPGERHGSFVYSKQPDLDETLAPPGRTVVAPPANDGPPPTDMAGFWNFRIKPGKQLRFDDLLYGRFGVDSYGVFRRLREEGGIPADVRFQVSLPSPHSAIDPFFEDADQWPEAYAAYLDGMEREIAKILELAPASDLVFQWDCAKRDRRPRHGGGECHEVVADAERGGEVRTARLPAGPTRRRDPRGSPARLSLVLRDMGRLARRGHG